MYEVMITVAEKTRSKEYPLAVVVLKDGERLQENLVKSLRDGRIFGNGVCYAGRVADPNNWPVNPTVDPRLVEVAA